MAKYECTLTGNHQELLDVIDAGILTGSVSASYEDGSDCSVGNTLCSVRVYERYSIIGQNRVSLNVTVVSADGGIFISAITSGGSQALIMKMNTIGEETFLGSLIKIVEDYKSTYE